MSVTADADAARRAGGATWASIRFNSNGASSPEGGTSASVAPAPTPSPGAAAVASGAMSASVAPAPAPMPGSDAMPCGATSASVAPGPAPVAGRAGIIAVAAGGTSASVELRSDANGIARLYVNFGSQTAAAVTVTLPDACGYGSAT